jgi:hypothetical protein
MTPEHQEIFRDLCTKVDDRSILDAAIECIARLKAENKQMRRALEILRGKQSKHRKCNVNIVDYIDAVLAFNEGESALSTTEQP